MEEQDFSILGLPGEDKEQKARDAAFNAMYSWRGKEFEGVSSSRKSLWEGLCHYAGYCDTQTAYNEPTLLTAHCKALLYICITPRERLKRLRAVGLPALLEDYEAWVDANIKISEEKDVLDLGIRILNDSVINQAEAVPLDGDTGK